MTRSFQKPNGIPLVDLRNKVPADLVDFVKSSYGIDPNTGLERSVNSALSTALRDLQRIKA